MYELPFSPEGKLIHKLIFNGGLYAINRSDDICKQWLWDLKELFLHNCWTTYNCLPFNTSSQTYLDCFWGLFFNIIFFFLNTKTNKFTEFKSEIGKHSTAEVKINSIYSPFWVPIYILPGRIWFLPFQRFFHLHQIFIPRKDIIYFFSFWCFDHFTEMGCMKSTICLTVFDSRLCRFCLTEH